MKKIIKLTEIELRKIVSESIKKILSENMLNEIGDSRRGQFMLGRINSKRKNGDAVSKKYADDAFRKANPSGAPTYFFQRGEDYQDSIDDASDPDQKEKAYKDMQSKYNSYNEIDMNKLGERFINFIKRYRGGALLQTIVDYESGNKTGKPSSPLTEIIPDFEDVVLGYKCTPKMLNSIEKTYKNWWHRMSGILM